MSNYEIWQAERYGDVLQEPYTFPDGTTDATYCQMERFAEWVELQAELALHDYDKD